MSTYEVRVWGIREHKGKDRKTGKPKSTYRLRWQVAGQVFGESYQTKALAESFRSKLLTAQREGVAFDEGTGLPEPMARELNSRSWYQHAVAFIDVKWPRSAASHRKSIADHSRTPPRHSSRPDGAHPRTRKSVERYTAGRSTGRGARPARHRTTWPRSCVGWKATQSS